MIVLDTSAAVEVVRQTALGKTYLSLLCEGERCVSCDLMIAETANVIRRLSRASGISPEQATSLCDDAIDLVDEYYPIEELRTEALRESMRLNHSTYDMFYFVLARRTGGCLVTADRKLMRLCEDNGVDCIHETNLGEEPC